VYLGGVCVDIHARDLKKAGESDDRLFSVAAWREAPYFSDAERAALALTEAATRFSDKPDPVPDEIWDGLEPHQRYYEASRGGLGQLRGWSGSLAKPLEQRALTDGAVVDDIS
jgi:Carboxymuconolactone decarboxylase family